MILVTGATGQLGHSVIYHLHQKIPASQITALVRSQTKAAHLAEQGVSVHLGDYDDLDALYSAMQGIQTVLLISGTDEENRVRQHQNVIDAARKAAVKRIAYTSRALKDRETLVNQLMKGHFDTEGLIKASGIPYTIFQNVLYMDAIPQFVGGRAVFERGINVPAGRGRVALALRDEMGEAIANALVKDKAGNRTYHLTGRDSYSFYDIANVLSSLSGQSVTYTPVETTLFETQLIGHGFSEVMARRITGFITDIANGQEDRVGADLETLLGRKPSTLKEGLAKLYNLV